MRSVVVWFGVDHFFSTSPTPPPSSFILQALVEDYCYTLLLLHFAGIILIQSAPPLTKTTMKNAPCRIDTEEEKPRRNGIFGGLSFKRPSKASKAGKAEEPSVSLTFWTACCFAHHDRYRIRKASPGTHKLTKLWTRSAPLINRHHVYVCVRGYD